MIGSTSTSPVFNSLVLVGTDRRPLDLVTGTDNPVRVLNITESLTAGFTTATLVLEDAAGLLERYPLVGLEYVYISIKGANIDNMGNCEKVFRIADIRNIDQDPNRPLMVYQLELYSPYVFESQKRQLQCSFKNKTESEIIRDICVDNLSITDNLLNIEDSQYKRNWTAPNMTPLQVIKIMTDQAITTKESRSANFFFFENRDGVNLKSLETLFKQEPIARLKSQVQNIDILRQDPISNIIEYTINSVTQPTNNRITGMHGHTISEIDLMEKKVTDYTYSYKDLLEFQVPIEGTENHLPYLDEDDSYRSKITPLYNHGTWQNAYRAIPTKLMTNQSLELINVSVTLGGNTNLSVGDIVIVDKITTDPLSDGYHRYLSGKFIITELRHVIEGSNAFTQLTIAKPGPKNELELLS